MPISVLITSYNEAVHIDDLMKSVEWADEILLIDSFSTDNTIELAEKYKTTILQHTYEYPAAQKNWAIPKAKYDWVLLLDADERVTPELKLEIQNLLQQSNLKDAYWIPRTATFMGRTIRFSGWRGDKVVRLFKRDKARYYDVKVHEEIDTSPLSVGKLQKHLVHHTYKNLPHQLDKIERYTTWGAQDRLKKSSSITFYHLFIKPLFSFFQTYFLRLGILDGKQGFIIAIWTSYSVFLRSLKIWRLQKGEEL